MFALTKLLDEGVRAFVFDIDDTLYLERDYVKSGFMALDLIIMSKYGINGFGETCWSLFLEGVRGNTFNLALETLKIPFSPSILAELVESYRNHEPKIEMRTDSRRLLSHLFNKFPIAFLTDGPLASQHAKARALKLEDFSPSIIFTSQINAPKPATLGFETLSRNLQCAGSQMLYVADNPKKDFGGPKKLGWKTVRVRRKDSLHEAVDSGSQVDYECTSLDFS